MNDTTIKRILVALDAGDANRSALMAAATLASQLQAELQALVVEDINLLRLAELPFARELMAGSQQSRRITPATMERQLREQTARLRGFVENAAQQAHVNIEFKALRGQIGSELQLAAQHMDLLILEKNTPLLRQSLRVGNITQDVLAAMNCNVLLMQHGEIIERPVAVLFDGTPASERALRLAVQLAHGDHDQLIVIYPAADTATQQAWLQQANALLQPYAIEAGQLQLHSNSSSELLHALLKCNGRVLVVETENDVVNAKSINSLLQQSHVPVIVMR